MHEGDYRGFSHARKIVTAFFGLGLVRIIKFILMKK